jgi:hypothetical protein
MRGQAPLNIYIFICRVQVAILYKLKHVQENCTCYNLNNPKIQVITCTKVACTCYNMYKILLKNYFNLYNI